MDQKILIVEDNLELLQLLRLHLRREGFAVSTASSGVQALKKTRALMPDLIVLDLVLPELDGFAVCETLKRHRETKDIPVIVMTGLTSEFARFAGLEAGAYECVTKPVSPGYLVSRIRHWLSTSAPAAGGGERSPCSSRAKSNTVQPSTKATRHQLAHDAVRLLRSGKAQEKN